MSANTRLATAADVARTQMTWAIEDGWTPTNWDLDHKQLPDATAAAIICELRGRVIGIKDDAGLFHADYDAENHRQAALSEVLDLLTAYSHPSEADTYNVRNVLR
ncbi:hypothetical protein [Nocardiopsis sp. NPDC058789]|uniref:hypothetical protein n=1 Tax=Nocardiopsis sp. NPDC058789 TaxID=3346634 RepID=UPI0036717CA2